MNTNLPLQATENVNLPSHATANWSSSTIITEESLNKTPIPNTVDGNVEKLKKTISVSINKSLSNNDQNLTNAELELCKTFVSSASKLHDDISSLILSLNFSNGNVDICHLDVPMVILSIGNIITDNYNACNALKKCLSINVKNTEGEPPNLLVLVQFILTTLIDYNIIFVPSDFKPTINTLIKYSIQLLEMTLPTIEKVVEEEKKTCYRFFLSLFRKTP